MEMNFNENGVATDYNFSLLYYPRYQMDRINQSTDFALTKIPTITEVAALNKAKIIDLNIIVPNKVVEATFSDGGKEKVVLREPDVFSLETAITILMCKHLLGGTKEYNNMVKHTLKDYDNKLKKEQQDREEQERIEKKREKRKAYKARRDEKRANEEKERQIEIQKEAYVRAMKELNK